VAGDKGRVGNYYSVKSEERSRGALHFREKFSFMKGKKEEGASWLFLGAEKGRN